MSQPAPLIPLRHFFDNPERQSALISPDGTRLSYLAPEEGIMNVWVETVGGEGAREGARAVTHDHARGIMFHGWRRDGKRILYLQDEGGNENFHLFTADPAAGPGVPSENLTPYESTRVIPVGFPRATPTQALVALNKRNPALFDPHRIDLDSGEAEMIAENPGNIIGWVADREGRLRAGIAQTPTGGWQVVVRDDEQSPWRELATYPPEDDVGYAEFMPDGRSLWLVTAAGAEYKRLLRADLSTGETTEVHGLDGADLAGVLVSDRTGELLSLTYEREREEVHPLDDAFARDWKRLGSVHSGDPHITSMDAEERIWVVSFDDPQDPGVTYLFERQTGEARLLFRPRPWLDPAHLAPMEPIAFTSRDGLRIHGYLTVPLGIEPRGLPMVLYVHGGPWVRDSWGYDPTVQLLANRGYAVLQVNYRGSTGYGKAFREAAVGEFGRRMHDDLIDAVSWAVERGVADPKRVAILGGSYGGYATLVGLTFTPDVFAAGISLCGPSSLVTLTQSFPPYFRPLLAGTWFRYVGDPDDPEQRADMEARSPLSKVDQIEAPLLIGQGANDVRVTKQEAEQMIAALRERGIDVEYVLKEDEGHGFLNPENRIDFMRAAERFLARHLGGRAENGA